MIRSVVRGLRADAGATAVEFAFVAPVFILLIFMIIELGLMLATQSLLDSGTIYATRQVEIGNANASNVSGFKSLVCARAELLVVSCSSSSQIYEVAGNSFSVLPVATVSKAGVLSPSTFNSGARGSDVLVQVVYARPFLLGVIAAFGGASQMTLMSTAVVQNGPST